MGRKEQKVATRERLVGVATRVFAREGIAAASTAAIAKAAELSHGSVFVHFATRDELLIAVIDAFGARLAAEFDGRLCAETETGERTLEVVLEAHLAALREFEEFYFRLVAEAYALPLGVQSAVFLLQAAVSHRIFIAAEHEMKAGTLRRMPRPMLFNTWIAMVHYHLAHRAMFVEPGQSLLAMKGEELKRFFLDLVSTQKRRS